MYLQPGELIARVILPAGRSPDSVGRTVTSGEAVGRTFRSGEREYYRKVGTRRAQAISKVCFAGTLALYVGVVADVRIALGSVAPLPIRAVRTEAALRGRPLDAAAIDGAAQTLTAEIAPIDDVRSTARYRTRVAVNLLREFLAR